MLIYFSAGGMTVSLAGSANQFIKNEWPYYSYGLYCGSYYFSNSLMWCEITFAIIIFPRYFNCLDFSWAFLFSLILFMGHCLFWLHFTWLLQILCDYTVIPLIMFIISCRVTLFLCIRTTSFTCSRCDIFSLVFVIIPIFLFSSFAIPSMSAAIYSCPYI